jgi:hypothetical protein
MVIETSFLWFLDVSICTIVDKAVLSQAVHSIREDKKHIVHALPPTITLCMLLKLWHD